MGPDYLVDEGCYTAIPQGIASMGWSRVALGKLSRKKALDLLYEVAQVERF